MKDFIFIGSISNNITGRRIVNRSLLEIVSKKCTFIIIFFQSRYF